MLRHAALTLALLATLFGGLAAAQFPCFGDDGFNVPGACCVPINQSNLPMFPPISIGSDGACIKDCNVEFQFPVSINLNSAIPVFCDLWVVPFTITGPVVTTAPTFLIAKYQRTWIEMDPAGVGPVRQVWRFLINTDLIYQPTPVGGPPCPIPVTALNGPVHFTGSLDYAQDCTAAGGGPFRAAINLTHLCGRYMHGPYSARPISPNPNPDRVYSFVGPAPFDFTAAGVVPVGPIIGDAMRTTDVNLGVFPAFWQCRSEVPILQGALNIVNASCPCADPSVPMVPPRFFDQDINFIYSCNTAAPFTFAGLPWPGLAPTGLVAFSLGRYVGLPGTFPGNEALSVYFGVAAGPDPCGQNPPIHVINGVGTVGGPGMFPINQPAANPFFQSVDLQNTLLVSPTTPPGLQIGFGRPFLSTMTWGLFLP